MALNNLGDLTRNLMHDNDHHHAFNHHSMSHNRNNDLEWPCKSTVSPQCDESTNTTISMTWPTGTSPAFSTTATAVTSDLHQWLCAMEHTDASNKFWVHPALIPCICRSTMCCDMTWPNNALRIPICLYWQHQCYPREMALQHKCNTRWCFSDNNDVTLSCEHDQCL